MRTNIINPIERGRYVDALWQAVKAQMIDWRSCQQAQASAMPQCSFCPAPSIVQVETGYACLECWKAREQE